MCKRKALYAKAYCKEFTKHEKLQKCFNPEV